MYDWANSAFFTTIVTAVFPIYFSKVAAKSLGDENATNAYLIATTVGMVASAIFAPYFGALADVSGRTKRLLAVTLAIAVLSVAGLFFVGEGDWKLGAGLFALANMAGSMTFVLYDSLLPRIASHDEVDRTSTAGYALGYIGGGLLLALNLAWIANPRAFGISGSDATLPTRLAFLSVAVWWLGFSIPMFLRVPEPPALRLRSKRTLAAEAFAQIVETYKNLRRYPQAFLMLGSFLLVSDGIGTIIRVAAIYGTEKDIDPKHLITAILLVQFIGVPCSFAFGWLAGKIGSKRAVLLGIGIYLATSVLAFFMDTTAEFYALAVLVATVQGGTQALARSMFATLVPKAKTAEFFGFFGVAEKFAGVVGPPLFALVAWWGGESRWGVLTVFPFLGLGAWLLLKVDLAKGRAQAGH